MKTIFYILIFILLPISPVWSADTTRAYCGGCIDYNSPSNIHPRPFMEIKNYGVYGGQFYYIGECKKLPLACHWECIEGDLYRICEDENFIPGPTKIPYIIVQCGYCKLKYSMRVGHWDCLVFDALDTIQVCDTTFLMDWTPATDSIAHATFFEKSLFLHLWHRIICHDSTVVKGK